MNYARILNVRAIELRKLLYIFLILIFGHKDREK
jgi:hypothetical protein